MPYKNDDFGELFQNAGSDYPLRTDSSDWDNVAERLSAAANEAKTTNSRFLRYAFVFLLLLSGSVIFYKFQFYTDEIALKERITSKAVGKPLELSTNNNLAPAGTKIKSNFGDLNLQKDQNRPLAAGNWNEIKIATIGSGTAVSVFKKNTNAVPTLDLDKTKISSSEHSYQSDGAKKLISENKNLNTINNRSTVGDINPKDVKSITQPVKFRPLPSKFYGTFYASPEFSMVKFQKVDEPGYKLGVGLGYSINKRFDIELGLQREHINFYSDGRQFERKALHIKSDDAVLSDVYGRSKITSVPLTFKYNFASKKIGHFYTAAGINLVQITHTETYDYTVTKNGTERDHSKNYSSASDPKYFTGLIASAGYEVKVCNWFNMKAEPYYQVPMQNFGVGRLPVASFGINIGVVKRL